MSITGYLTIDDCPSKDFLKKIDYLEKHKIPAILFCTGNLITEELENDIITAIKKGFIIGNHSWSHYDFTTLSKEEIKEEIIKTDELISQLYNRAGVDQTVKYFRFPYLKQSDFALKLLVELDYQQEIDMDRPIDTQDWNKYLTLKDILDGIKNVVLSKDEFNLILMHDFSHNHDYFEPMVECFKERGVQFVQSH